MPSLFNSWWKPSKTNRTARRAAKSRLRVEQLEDRVTPAAGMLDTTFSGDGKVTTDLGGSNSVHAVAVDGLGRTLVAGDTNQNFKVTRYQVDGSLDMGFGTGGTATVDFGSNDSARGVAVDGLGRILLGGFSTIGGDNNDFAVARLTDAGILDASFSDDSKATVDFGGDDVGFGVAVDGLGRVVLGGYSRIGGAPTPSRQPG